MRHHPTTPLRFVLPLLMALAACATPQMPPGGPPDQTPPALEAADPPDGALRVATDRIELTFSEYVDEGSFARAFSIVPDFDRPPAFDWHGRRVVIRLPEPLRPATTYILTLDTNLRDLRGVALRQPITLAFSTGDRLDRGRLAGRVLDAVRGTGVPGLDVYAYPAPGGAAPDSLPPRPAFRTQTDTEGRFHLDYLSDAPFFVIALRDRNRNRRPDPLEAFAAPPAPALVPDTLDASLERTWVLTTLDTLPPVLRQVQPRSNRRLALRFSDPVRLASTDPAGWLVVDSVAGAPRPVRAVYQVPEDPLRVFVLTDPLAPVPHRLHVHAVVDSSGNAVREGTARFVPPATPDTVALRFRAFVPDSAAADPYVLAPGERPGVRFNQPVDSTRMARLVAVRDTAGQALAYRTTTPDGVTYRLTLDPWPGVPFEVRVDARPLGADTVYVRRFRRMTPDETGALGGYVAGDDTTGTLVVELFEAGGKTPLRTAVPDTSGLFLFRDLPGGRRYRVRAFADRDGNGRWDGGRLRPYRPAEPAAWSDVLPAVRPRWETIVDDTLRVRHPAAPLPR
ncbi:MAG: hypothetical protein KatS3mg042_1764 [Rhodothermaceae bacterium]|nr:MAG: hypothetical protein KatS3mg042_1764 [Rhodothermaceae bacterium]